MGFPDVAPFGRRDRASMGTRHERYGVVFREGAGPSVAGALEVSDGRLLLAGRARGRSHEVSVALTDVVDIHIGRLPVERLNGFQTIVLVRRRMPLVQVAPLGAGLLHEIADLLTTLTAATADRADEVAVVVPLKPGCIERAKRLLELGPPLDPATLGLTGHEVYLREREAVFVFRGPTAGADVAQAMRTPALWRAGIAWQQCVAGRPRITKTVESIAPEETPFYRWAPPDDSVA